MENQDVHYIHIYAGPPPSTCRGSLCGSSCVVLALSVAGRVSFQETPRATGRSHETCEYEDFKKVLKDGATDGPHKKIFKRRAERAAPRPPAHTHAAPARQAAWAASRQPARTDRPRRPTNRPPQTESCRTHAGQAQGSRAMYIPAQLCMRRIYVRSDNAVLLQEKCIRISVTCHSGVNAEFSKPPRRVGALHSHSRRSAPGQRSGAGRARARS